MIKVASKFSQDSVKSCQEILLFYLEMILPRSINIYYEMLVSRVLAKMFQILQGKSKSFMSQ